MPTQILSIPEIGLFYSLLFQLYVYANQKLNIIFGIDSVDDIQSAPQLQVAKIRDAIFEDCTATQNSKIFADFIAEKRDQLPRQHLHIYENWEKYFVVRDFFIERFAENGAIFIDASNEEEVFLVRGILSKFEDMFPAQNLPLRVHCILLPFAGRILYDGLFNTLESNVALKHRLAQAYETAKRKNKIIRVLDKDRTVKINAKSKYRDPKWHAKEDIERLYLHANMNKCFISVNVEYNPVGQFASGVKNTMLGVSCLADTDKCYCGLTNLPYGKCCKTKPYWIPLACIDPLQAEGKISHTLVEDQSVTFKSVSNVKEFIHRMNNYDEYFYCTSNEYPKGDTHWCFLNNTRVQISSMQGTLNFGDVSVRPDGTVEASAMSWKRMRVLLTILAEIAGDLLANPSKFWKPTNIAIEKSSGGKQIVPVSKQTASLEDLQLFSTPARTSFPARKKQHKVRVCAACGQAGVGLKQCSRCHSVWYCGRDCQAVDWKRGHKFVCGKK